MLCQARAREALAAGAKAAEAAAERELALGEELKVRRENSPREFAERIRRENSPGEFAERIRRENSPRSGRPVTIPSHKAVKPHPIIRLSSRRRSRSSVQTPPRSPRSSLSVTWLLQNLRRRRRRGSMRGSDQVRMMYLISSVIADWMGSMIGGDQVPSIRRFISNQSNTHESFIQ